MAGQYRVLPFIQKESHVTRTTATASKIRKAAYITMEKADTRIITLKHSELAEEDKDLSEQIEGVSFIS